mgnify:CR=1 FL=1
MAVKIKDDKVKDEKGTVINFNSRDYIAVKGTKDNPFFAGETKVVHKVHGQKLIDKKYATKVDAEVIKEENLTRAVKDLPKK